MYLVNNGGTYTSSTQCECGAIPTQKSANDLVNHPNHYNAPGRKECIEEMIDIFGVQRVIDWCEMTAYKYEYRRGMKMGEEENDPRKMEWYRKKAEELRMELNRERTT